MSTGGKWSKKEFLVNIVKEARIKIVLQSFKADTEHDNFFTNYGFPG